MATPTLKRSWAYVGLSANATDTGNNFKFFLEKSGTPCAVTVGDLILVSVAYLTSGNTLSVSDDGGNTYNTAVTVNSATGRTYAVVWSIATAYASVITVGFGQLTTDVQADVSLWYNVASSSPIDVTSTATQQTPTTNTNPNLNAGSMTTGVSGDLIYTVVFADQVSLGIPHAINSVTAGSGATLLFAETGYGGFGQYQIQSSAGAINAGMLVNQTTHDVFAILAVAIKPGSGGSAPNGTCYIIRSQMYYPGAQPSSVANTTQVVAFPTSGNLFIIENEIGSAIVINSITDSLSDAWNTVAGLSGTDPQIFYAKNVTGSAAMTVSFHFGAVTGNILVGMYDVVGAKANPLDTTVTAANSSSLTAANSGATINTFNQSSAGQSASDIPSMANIANGDLIFGCGPMGTGPCSGCGTGSYDYVTATWNTGGGDGNAFGNGDVMWHWFAGNTGSFDQTLTFTNSVASSVTVAAVAFGANILPPDEDFWGEMHQQETPLREAIIQQFLLDPVEIATAVPATFDDENSSVIVQKWPKNVSQVFS